VEKRTVAPGKMALGIGALAGWVLLFAAGLLIETVEYRLVLAPRSVAKQIGEAEAGAITGPQSAPGAATGRSNTPLSRNSPPFSPFVSFFASILCFTPINLALLTLTAGLLGGCASNITIETMPDKQRESLHRDHPRRHMYLQEPPVSAAIRGFIVFLCVIAGLYVAMDDPFKDPTPGQYIRLAGMLSILGLVVGYDASRLEDWLRIIPGPGNVLARGGNGQSPPAATLAPGDSQAMVVQEKVKITEREFASAEVQKSGNGEGKVLSTETSIPATQQEAAAKEASAETALHAPEA
jgi:hypothetical protein